MTTLRGGFFQTARPQSVILLDRFLNNLPEYLTSSKVPLPSGYFHNITEFKGELSECACASVETYDRLKNNNRTQTEALIIEEIEKRFSHLKKPKAPLKIVSFASGKLLQDFILCAKLLSLGYSIDITLIDKDIENLRKALGTFQLLKCPAEDLGLTLKIAEYENLLDYVHSNPQKDIQVAYAIDFDHFDREFSSLCQIKSQLSKDGFFLLTLRNQLYNGRIIYDLKGEESKFVGNPEFASSLSISPFKQCVRLPDYVARYDEKYAHNTKAAITSFFQHASFYQYSDKITKVTLSYRDFLEMGGIFAENDEDLQALEAYLEYADTSRKTESVLSKLMMQLSSAGNVTDLSKNRLNP